MRKNIRILRHLARLYKLNIVQAGADHYIIKGGKVIVQYWPHSRHKTAYASGAIQGERWHGPQSAIMLALHPHKLRHDR